MVRLKVISQTCTNFGKGAPGSLGLASMHSGIMRGMASALDEHADELGMVLHDIIPEGETYDEHPLDGLRSAFYDAADDLRKHEKAIREAGEECA